jgi:hypothetical protein
MVVCVGADAAPAVMCTGHWLQKHRWRRSRRGSGDGDASVQQRNAVGLGRRLDCVPMRHAAPIEIFWPFQACTLFYRCHELQHLHESESNSPFLSLAAFADRRRVYVDPSIFGSSRLYSWREIRWLFSARQIRNGRCRWQDICGMCYSRGLFSEKIVDRDTGFCTK